MTAEESVLALGRTSLTCQKHIGQAARCDAQCCLLSVSFPSLLPDGISLRASQAELLLQPWRVAGVLMTITCISVF